MRTISTSTWKGSSVSSWNHHLRYHDRRSRMWSEQDADDFRNNVDVTDVDWINRDDADICDSSSYFLPRFFSSLMLLWSIVSPLSVVIFIFESGKWWQWGRCISVNGRGYSNEIGWLLVCSIKANICWIEGMSIWIDITRKDLVMECSDITLIYYLFSILQL